MISFPWSTDSLEEVRDKGRQIHNARPESRASGWILGLSGGKQVILKEQSLMEVSQKNRVLPQHSTPLLNFVSHWQLIELDVCS
jgi:hypothetical protein